MFRRGFLPLILIGLLLLAFAGAGRSAAYRAGWSQGYYAGQQVAREDGGAAAAAPYAPYAPYAPGGFHHGAGFGFRPFFCGLGLLLPFGLFLLFMGMIGRFAFGRRHGPKHFAGWHGPWGHHGPGKHKAPWWNEDEEPIDDTIRKA